MIILLAVCVFTISALFTRRLCDPASRFHVLDHPNERSLHTRPTPRSGGIAILTATIFGLIVLGWWYRNFDELAWIGLGVLLVAVVSFVDDWYQVPVIDRLLAHLVAGGIILWGGFSLHGIELPGIELTFSPWAGVGISMLFIVWMVNLYNFMDGMDGFAGGMAAIGFGAFAGLGWFAGNALFLATSLIIASAAAGFLTRNFPPARIFMGDVGSSSLGLLAAALSLWGVRDGVFPFWTALLVFSPFLADATVTLLRRLVRGDKIWQAHRSHYYQRLVQLGWGHRKTVLWEYGIMLACSISAVWARFQEQAAQARVLLAWCLVYPSLMIFVHKLEVRRKPVA